MAEPITIADIMDAITSCQESQPSRGATAQEIASQAGRDVFCVRREIAKALNAGTLELIKEKRRCIDGVCRTFPAYRTVAKPGAGKRKAKSNH